MTVSSSAETANVPAGNPWNRSNHAAAAASTSPPAVSDSAIIIGDHSWPPLTASERQNSSSAAPPGGGEGPQPMTTGTVPSAPTIAAPAINPNPNSRRGGGRNQHNNNNNHQNYRWNYGNRGPGLYFLSDLIHHPPPFHPNGPPPPPPGPGPVQYWPLPFGWDVYRATTNIVHRPPPPPSLPRPLLPPLLQNGRHRPGPVFIDSMTYPNLHYHHHVHFPHHMRAGAISPAPLLVLPPPSALDKLMGDIRKQIEYYFSEENLAKDVYLKKQMDNFGWVDLNEIGNFNRVKALTRDIELVRRSLMSSDVIELEGFKIRRRNNWGRWLLDQYHQS